MERDMCTANFPPYFLEQKSAEEKLQKVGEISIMCYKICNPQQMITRRSNQGGHS
jgi:hypothetical protein